MCGGGDVGILLAVDGGQGARVVSSQAAPTEVVVDLGANCGERCVGGGRVLAERQDGLGIRFRFLLPRREVGACGKEVIELLLVVAGLALAIRGAAHAGDDVGGNRARGFVVDRISWHDAVAVELGL